MNDIRINFIKHPEKPIRYMTRMESDLAIETCLKGIETYFWVISNLTQMLILGMFTASPKNPRFIPLRNQFFVLFKNY